MERGRGFNILVIVYKQFISHETITANTFEQNKNQEYLFVCVWGSWRCFAYVCLVSANNIRNE